MRTNTLVLAMGMVLCTACSITNTTTTRVVFVWDVTDRYDIGFHQLNKETLRKTLHLDGNGLWNGAHLTIYLVGEVRYFSGQRRDLELPAVGVPVLEDIGDREVTVDDFLNECLDALRSINGSSERPRSVVFRSVCDAIQLLVESPVSTENRACYILSDLRENVGPVRMYGEGVDLLREQPDLIKAKLTKGVVIPDVSGISIDLIHAVTVVDTLEGDRWERLAEIYQEVFSATDVHVGGQFVPR